MLAAPNRRQFLNTSGAGLIGLSLPGCATTRATALASPPAPECFPRVKVSADRIIRTVAGLRPYRDQGFVVRGEAIGDKRLVHNYGHGGAGITLSWGTSRLAVDLGLPGHSGGVAVLGAGVVGLSTARLVQEAGFPVTIYAAALPPDTTSNIAGGQFHPYGHFNSDRVTPEWRAQFARAVDYARRRFQIMVGDDYGIRWLPTYAERNNPERQVIPHFPPINRMVAQHEHSFPIDTLARYDTMYVEPGRYLRQLLRDVRADGGQVRVQRFASRDALAAIPERLIFNCTGLGARDLFGDQDLRPVRGQLAILLPQPEINYAYTTSYGHMFPRPDGIVLGGTFERDVWSTEPEPAAIAEIIAGHQRLFAGWRCGPSSTGA